MKLTDTWVTRLRATLLSAPRSRVDRPVGCGCKHRKPEFYGCRNCADWKISATQAGNYNAVFTSQPGTSRLRQRWVWRLLHRVLFWNHPSRKRRCVNRNLCATDGDGTDAGSTRRCPVPNVPVTFTRNLIARQRRIKQQFTTL